MASDDDKPKEGMTVGNRFVVKKYLNGGSFGCIYTGKSITSGEEVAIKMEKKDLTRPQLPLEFRFFKQLKAYDQQRHKGIPRVYYFGECGLWSALVMDLLGPSLEKVHSDCDSRFSLKTTALISLQLMDIMEYFHSCRLIFRDVKPENFLFGRSGTNMYSTIHIIDLGLSKEYIDEKGEHMKFRSDKGMTGTVRYVSINSHKSYEISRRDDMEALGYMIVFLIKGELPWIGLKGKDVKTKYNAIGKVKMATKPQQLCADIPHEFADYISNVRELKFEEEPKYKEYIKLFNKLLERHNFKNDGIYDFDKQHKPRTFSTDIINCFP